jgi:hypothetical protein
MELFAEGGLFVTGSAEKISHSQSCHNTAAADKWTS